MLLSHSDVEASLGAPHNILFFAAVITMDKVCFILAVGNSSNQLSSWFFAGLS